MLLPEKQMAPALGGGGHGANRTRSGGLPLRRGAPLVHQALPLGTGGLQVALLHMAEAADLGVVVAPTGISQAGGPGHMLVYPSPAKDLLYFKGTGIEKAELFSISGRLVATRQRM